jgi:hypothetical protein
MLKIETKIHLDVDTEAILADPLGGHNREAHALGLGQPEHHLLPQHSAFVTKYADKVHKVLLQFVTDQDRE